MNEIYKKKIVPFQKRIKKYIKGHKIWFLLVTIFVCAVFGVIVLSNSRKTVLLTNVELTSYSNVTQEDGRTVYSLNAKKDYIYKSNSKKGLDAAREFLQVNPSLLKGNLFPENFEKNTLVTRQVLDKNDKYLIKRNIPLSNEHYFFNQTIDNIPVYGAVVAVHIKNENEVYASSGNISTNKKKTSQKITFEKAKEIALSKAKDETSSDLIVKTTKKYYFNEKLLGLSNNSINHLALEVSVESVGEPVVFNTKYFIDLENGKVLYSESQIHEVLNRNIYNCKGGSCSLQRQEGDAAVGDLEVDNLYSYFGTVYNYFFDNFGRDSYDNKGAPYIGYVNSLKGMVFHGALVDCPNAFWNGYEMVYCSRMVVLDVTGHELTHAITSSTANLIYEQESGATNEAISDIFASAMDNNWDIGEDIPVNIGLPVPLRSMSNPPLRSHPDKLSSPLFQCGSGDHGGVHTNSGVINKTFFLMSEGGTFNGCAINGIGRTKAYPIVYHALTRYLTRTSNFKDVYIAFMQACNDLYGSSSSECDNVNRAMQATEIDQQPQELTRSPICTGIKLKPATCSTSGSPTPNPTLSITPSPTSSTTPTPTLTTTPTPDSTQEPTSTPTPPKKGYYQKFGTPTPTPDQYFTCKPDPKCSKSGKNIQLCPLLCTPQ